MVGLLVVEHGATVAQPGIKPGRVYPLYGFHYGIQRAITRLTNIRFFTTLFGDSSCIVHYLRCARVRPRAGRADRVELRHAVKHDNPFLSHGRQWNDGRRRLSIINADFSSTSFRVSPASIGPSNFLGNRIAYPSRGRTGDNCLLATKVMVPIDGRSGKAWDCWAHPASRSRARWCATPSSTTWPAGTSCAAASPPRTGTTSHLGAAPAVRWFHCLRHSP